MALWSRVQNLHPEGLEQISLVYGENFPIDVRSQLADWIEEQRWSDIDPDNPQHDTYAEQLFSSLFTQLEAKKNMVEVVDRIKLIDGGNKIMNKYSCNPQLLVRVLQHCLNNDLRIVQQAEELLHCVGPVPMKLAANPSQEINMLLEKLRHQTQKTADQVRAMIQCQEAFVLQYQEMSKRQAQLAQVTSPDVLAKLSSEKEMYDKVVRHKVQELIALRMDVVERFHQNFMEVSELQKTVLDTELIRWKRGQQLDGNGVFFNNNLDTIQEWCEALADIIWQSRQQIRQVDTLVSQAPLNHPGNTIDRLPVLNNQMTGLLSSLVTSTFIIEKQPPQVMKTNTRFMATVRLLVGSKLGVYMTPPQVKVTIISEAQAIALLKNDKVGTGEVSGEILNNIGTMEYIQSTRQLSVSFRNMQLRKIKRAEKKGTESVMDEKFSLLFQSQFKVGGGELVFQVWTLSLPVVVIVHGNQEPHAWATVTWDNAFAEPGRVPFQVPEKVSWKEVAEVLSTKFMQQTGRGLTDDNLVFLGTKIFRCNQFNESSAVSWSQFCKEPLPDRNFTFWEWFHAIMKVTREHLKNLWVEGLIIGFVGRHQAEEMLVKHNNGTFLLRFSDSELGGVTIAWVADSKMREGPEVYMVQPFTSRDIGIRGLADRICDLQNLISLYPDIPKDKAFGKYYTPLSADGQIQSNSGYVRPVLVTQLPILNNLYGFDGSSPNTPQSMHSEYHDPHNSDMQAAAQFQDMDYMFPSMDDIPVDFSNINVSDFINSYQTPT